jgi:hypothetical protein
MLAKEGGGCDSLGMINNYGSEPFVTQIGPRSVQFFRQYANLAREGYVDLRAHLILFGGLRNDAESDGRQVEAIVSQADDVSAEEAEAALLFMRANEGIAWADPLALPWLN